MNFDYTQLINLPNDNLIHEVIKQFNADTSKSLKIDYKYYQLLFHIQLLKYKLKTKKKHASKKKKMFQVKIQ